MQVRGQTVMREPFDDVAALAGSERA